MPLIATSYQSERLECLAFNQPLTMAVDRFSADGEDMARLNDARQLYREQARRDEETMANLQKVSASGLGALARQYVNAWLGVDPADMERS